MFDAKIQEQNIFQKWEHEKAQLDSLHLWCVHVSGPDDIYAMSSKKMADEEAARINKSVGFNYEAGDPDITAVATLWPYSAKAHAEALEEEAKS